MSGRGTPGRRVYLVRRVMAVIVLLLVFGLLVPQAYQALVNTPTGSETRSTEDAPADNSGEQADRKDRENSREATPDTEQASGGTPARTEQEDPAADPVAEPSPPPAASEEDGQDDGRESEQARESEEPPAEEDATESPAPADESAEAENVESTPLRSAVPAVVESVEAGGAGNWDEFSAASLPVVSTYDEVAARAARKERLRAERRAAARNARATAPVVQPAFETPAADNTASAANRATYRGNAEYQYAAAPARNTQRVATQGGAAPAPARSAAEPAREPASAREAGTTEQQTATTTCWAYASSYSYAWSSQYGAESNYDVQYDHDSAQYGTDDAQYGAGKDSAACGAEAYSGARSGDSSTSAGAGAGSEQGSSYRWQYSN